MDAVIGYAASACVAAGFIVAVLVLARTGDVRLALQSALDFWLAAGLLRLGQTPGWQPLAVTAIIIVVRRLAGAPSSRPSGRS
jgi:uncharacterized membrane protein